MFLLSKLVGLATEPMFWVVLVLLIAVVQMPLRPQAARGWVLMALAILLLGGWAPLPDALLRHLERQYPEPPALPAQQYAGVMVLGGALESGYVGAGTDEPQVNGAAERMTTVLPLLRQAPDLAVVFTGGEGEYFGSGPSEAERARRFFVQLGLDPQRIRLENQSRNTYENAVFTARLSGIDPHKPWILVTSASHMPRALAVFRKQGWNVTPYSVDFRAGLATPWTTYSLGDFEKWRVALHEYLGLLAYRLTDRM
jgi:uncharacterized SAM-binding protein YcdF (DUF218 family)